MEETKKVINSQLASYLTSDSKDQLSSSVCEEVLDVVARCGKDKEVKTMILEGLLGEMLRVIGNPRIAVFIKKAWLKTVNLLLSAGSGEVRNMLAQEFSEDIEHLVDLLYTCGDYDLESSIVEFLLRLRCSPGYLDLWDLFDITKVTVSTKSITYQAGSTVMTLSLPVTQAVITITTDPKLPRLVSEIFPIKATSLQSDNQAVGKMSMSECSATIGNTGKQTSVQYGKCSMTGPLVLPGGYECSSTVRFDEKNSKCRVPVSPMKMSTTKTRKVSLSLVGRVCSSIAKPSRDKVVSFIQLGRLATPTVTASTFPPTTTTPLQDTSQ